MIVYNNGVPTGGDILLDLNEFSSFCGDNNTLRVVLDPNNAIQEVDESNNEEIISGITLICPSKSYFPT